MKVKLKTKEQLIDEFGFEEFYNGKILSFDSNDTKWWIPTEVLKYLGTEIEVEEYNNINLDYYTHWDKMGFLYNDQWFEEVKEEEVKEEEVKETDILMDKDRYFLVLRYIMYIMRKRKYTKQTIIENTVKAGQSYNILPEEVEDVLMTSIDFYI